VFTSTEEEHRATRTAVGVFDVYYQVAVEVAGAMRRPSCNTL
jgi:glycine cleavage system aminomethyltransferase T